jgi:YhcH/YjgK/YiaL family protein
MKNCLTTMITLLLVGCSGTNREVTDEKFTEWIKSSQWITDFPFRLDKNIDSKSFYVQNKRNEAEWNAAYNFLKSNDLSQMPTGRYDLTPKGTYATVTDYQTKEHETAKYEAHRKYIDIQYVAYGEEYIDILPLSEIKEEAEYDAEKDIVFYNGHLRKRLKATNKEIFVFFPEDAHKPCLKIDTVKPVRKIVVKIPFSNNQ